MKKLNYLSLVLTLFLFSCGSAVPHILGKKTPHEKYEDKLKDTGLSNTPEGRQWLAASDKAILQPVNVPVPFKLQGNFDKEKPRAIGLSFTAKQGEQILFDLIRDPGFTVYADLYKVEGVSSTLLLSAETDASDFKYEIRETGNYILRLQPELRSGGNYTLAMSASPLFAFPVSGNKARVGSFWGDSRDGGKRDHEGIDIFAPKRTPVIAIADGYISAVKNGGLGGKTISLRPAGTNYSLYYAHLDEQLVKEGQIVKKGEVLGLVGNTGNARTTPSHLHFGIYSSGGAVDPLPFVNKNVKAVPEVAARELSGHSLQLIKSKGSGKSSSPEVNSILAPLGVVSNGYLAESPDGEQFIIPFNSVKAFKNPEAAATGAKPRQTGETRQVRRRS